VSKEPDNVVLRHLREIRKTLELHSKQLEGLPRMEKQLADLATLVRYSLGQTSETRFRQTEQEARIDELFEKLEQLLSKPEPA
jgi:hypothetical protein